MSLVMSHSQFKSGALAGSRSKPDNFQLAVVWVAATLSAVGDQSTLRKVSNDNGGISTVNAKPVDDFAGRRAIRLRIFSLSEIVFSHDLPCAQLGIRPILTIR